MTETSWFDKMKESFYTIDLDHDGLITADELQKLTQSIDENLSETDLRALIAKVDKNKDGKIDFIEFCEITSEFFKYQYEKND